MTIATLSPRAAGRLAPHQTKESTRPRANVMVATIGIVVTAILAVVFSMALPGAVTAAHATGGVDTFCASPYGTTTWTDRNPEACQGTISAYRDGSFLGNVNEVQLIADNPPRTEVDLDRWCSDHSFACAVAISGFFYLIQQVRS